MSWFKVTQAVTPCQDLQLDICVGALWMAAGANGLVGNPDLDIYEPSSTHIMQI